MSYEEAPATKILATHCACCARPLLDAVSVETGVGPECRKKHKVEVMQGVPDYAEVERFLAGVGPYLFGRVTAAWGDPRKIANVLVHFIALEQDGAEVLLAAAMLSALGFTVVAVRIMKRLVTVRICLEQGDTRFTVTTPYNEAASSAWRTIPSRRWDKERKVNVVDVKDKKALWTVLRTHFAGAHAEGPQGPFVV